MTGFTHLGKYCIHKHDPMGFELAYREVVFLHFAISNSAVKTDE